MLNTKIQPQNFLGSGEEDFQEFLPYMDMQPSCSFAQNHLNKLAILFQQKAMWNLVKIAQAVSEKKTFKNYTILYMYIA